jgi:hypothetical protein
MGQLHHPEARGGGRAWLALGVGILAYDLFTTNETMTNAHRRFAEAHPIGAKVVSWTLREHLLGRLPHGADPIEIMFDHLPHRS